MNPIEEAVAAPCQASDDEPPRTESAQVEALLAQLEQVSNDYDKLSAEKAGLQDLVRRREADYDNFRKRVERERQELVDFAAADAVKSLLPIVDDFERALRAAESQEALGEFAKGMDLIRQRLLEALTKLGLQPVEAANTPFDPNVHYAVQKVEREDVEDQTVLEDLQRGYFFKTRLLRPAMVKVAVRP
jgi:molecular chaperone GrpE